MHEVKHVWKIHYSFGKIFKHGRVGKGEGADQNLILFTALWILNLHPSTSQNLGNVCNADCTVRFFFVYDYSVLQLYLTSLIKISYHVFIRNRCFRIPSAIDVSLYVNHFSVELIIFGRVRRTAKETVYKLRHVCLSSSFRFLSVCLSLYSHRTIPLLNVFRERLGCGFLLKSIDQLQVLLK